MNHICKCGSEEFNLYISGEVICFKCKEKFHANLDPVQQGVSMLDDFLINRKPEAFFDGLEA